MLAKCVAVSSVASYALLDAENALLGYLKTLALGDALVASPMRRMAEDTVALVHPPKKTCSSVK